MSDSFLYILFATVGVAFMIELRDAFFVDRPFFYQIRHQPSNVSLFKGHVNVPEIYIRLLIYKRLPH